MIVFHESDVTAVIRMLPSFEKHANVVMGYCYLFGVSPMHLKAKKLRILLEELKRLFDGESFTFQRRQYSISRAGIAEALDVMVKRNFTSTLTNHNYLKQIMIGIADREGKAAGRKAEADLRGREEALRSGSRGERYPVPEEAVEAPAQRLRPIPDGRDQLTPEEREANRKRTQELLKKIG